MSNSRNLANIISGNYDIPANSLDNAIPADGSITAAKLASSLDLTGKTVTLPSGVGGKVLQMVFDTSTVNVSASGTRQTLLTISITPSSASNKIYISFVGQIRAFQNTNAYWDIVLKRDTTSTDLVYHFGGNSTASSSADTASIVYVDSPSSTSAVTYSVGINRGSSGTSYVETDTQRYTLVAMEIAA